MSCIGGIFLPQTHNPCLSMRGTAEGPFTSICPELLKALKNVKKKKENLRSWHSREWPEETR